MSDVVIRAATPADRGAVLSLLEQASLPTQDLVGTADVQFWVADDSGEIVGAIGLERYGSTGLLRSLAVSPRARERGIGGRLVECVEHEGERAGLREMVLLTQTARTYFERHGYSAISRDTAPDAVKSSAQFRSLCPASATCMRKPLPVVTGSGGRDSSTTVLFLCTGNSCRSILAEATFNHLAPAGWNAMSAGSKPAGYVHPRSLALLAREGISTEGCFSKSWEDLPRTPDIVITVCSSAAGETCPVYLGGGPRAHWGVDDPAHVTGPDEVIDAAFASAYHVLRRRIEAFLTLPLTELRADPARLQAEIDSIGARVS